MTASVVGTASGHDLGREDRFREPRCQYRSHRGVGAKIEKFSGRPQQRAPIGSTELDRDVKKELDRGQDRIGVDVAAADQFLSPVIGTEHDDLPFH
jgi:hypothetical protein